jgi:5-methylcytosine-specific restriction endonuclease McrA
MSDKVEGWTEGRMKSFITSTIRGGFRRFPNKYVVLKESQTGRKTNPSSGKLAMHHQCASCRGEFTSANIQVDHISPIVDPKVGFTSWDDFIENLFCKVENLQALCKSCHAIKTKEERAEATIQRRKNA